MLPENNHLHQLLLLVFPAEIIDHFAIRKIDVINGAVQVHLYEKSNDTDHILQTSSDFAPPIIIEDFPLRDKNLMLHLHQRKQPEGQSNFIFRNSQIIANGNQMTKTFAEFIRENEHIRMSSADMNTIVKAKQQYQRLMDYCNELEQERGTLADQIDLLRKELKEFRDKQ